MTLKEMCEMAAVNTDRGDDFVTITGPDGKPVYDPEDDPGRWFKTMKLAINTAYREAARRLLMPDVRTPAWLGENGTLDLSLIEPGVYQVKAVYSADGSTALRFDFVTKFLIRVQGKGEGDEVLLQYHYIPEPLENFNDEPEFPDALVDPMIYISKACADIWRSEKKLEMANAWDNQYYNLLGGIQNDLKSPGLRRIRRPAFR